MANPAKIATQAALGCLLMALGFFAMVLGAATAWAIFTTAGAALVYLVIRDV